jgi:nucleoside-diphosphate-sugar epimerase
LEPTHIYGASKAAASIFISQLAREKKFPAVILRPFGIWGEGEPEFRLVPQIVKACVTQAPLDLTAGEQIRDYTHVEDMSDNIAAYLEAAEFVPGDIVNAGSGQTVKLKDFVLQVASALGGGQELMRFGRLPYRPNEMMMLAANIEKISRVIHCKCSASVTAARVKKMAEIMQAAAVQKGVKA